MAGVIPHIAAGVLVGALLVNRIPVPENAVTWFMLFCIFMSCLPDIYYLAVVTGYYPDTQDPSWTSIHLMLHNRLEVISLIAAFALIIFIDVPNETMALVGLLCVLIHIAMDYLIVNVGVLL